MTIDELRSTLKGCVWTNQGTTYKFLENTLYVNNQMYSQWSVREQEGRFYLMSGLRGGQELLITITRETSPIAITISPMIDGDSGFKKILLTEVI